MVGPNYITYKFCGRYVPRQSENGGGGGLRSELKRESGGLRGGLRN